MTAHSIGSSSSIPAPGGRGSEAPQGALTKSNGEISSVSQIQQGTPSPLRDLAFTVYYAALGVFALTMFALVFTGVGMPAVLLASALVAHFMLCHGSSVNTSPFQIFDRLFGADKSDNQNPTNPPGPNNADLLNTPHFSANKPLSPVSLLSPPPPPLQDSDTDALIDFSPRPDRSEYFDFDWFYGEDLSSFVPPSINWPAVPTKLHTSPSTPVLTVPQAGAEDDFVEIDLGTPDALSSDVPPPPQDLFSRTVAYLGSFFERKQSEKTTPLPVDNKPEPSSDQDMVKDEVVIEEPSASLWYGSEQKPIDEEHDDELAQKSAQEEAIRLGWVDTEASGAVSLPESKEPGLFFRNYIRSPSAAPTPVPEPVALDHGEEIVFHVQGPRVLRERGDFSDVDESTPLLAEFEEEDSFEPATGPGLRKIRFFPDEL